MARDCLAALRFLLCGRLGVDTSNGLLGEAQGLSVVVTHPALPVPGYPLLPRVDVPGGVAVLRNESPGVTQIREVLSANGHLHHVR